MVSRPIRLGRQCNTKTWTSHSKNGNAASIASGTQQVGDAPIADDDARGQRNDQGDADHPRRRVAPELPRRVGQREPTAPGPG